MIWRCPKLYRYWSGIIGKINVVFGTSLNTEAKVCLLGLIEEEGILGATQTAVTRCLFQGRKLIAHKWQDKNPPTVTEWVQVVKETIEKEKYIYTRRGGIIRNLLKYGSNGLSKERKFG